MSKTKELLAKLSQLRYPLPVKIIVTALVIYLVNKSLGKDNLSALLNGISLFPAAVAFFLGCVAFYCQVRRWKIILGVWGIDAGEIAALRTMLWGCLLAFITPGRAGELFRGFSLPVPKKSRTVYAVLVDKLFAGAAALAAGVVCCAISLVRNKAVCWGHWTIIIGAISVVSLACVVFALRSHSFAQTTLSRLPSFSGKHLSVLVIYSISAQVLFIIQTAALLSMFGSEGFFDTMIASGQAYSFMLFFPFFIANMGIREYSFRLFLGCGRPPGAIAGLSSLAFGASTVILIVNIILPALIGLAWWIIKKRVTSYQLPVASEIKNDI